MLSHPPGRHHTGGGTTRARGDDAGGGTMHGDTTEGGQHRGGMTRVRGDDAEGGDDIWGHHRGWDNMWCPPCRPPSPVIPPSVWCLLGGVGQHVVSPVLSPLSPLHHPPFSVVSPRRGGTTCGVPRVSPLTRVVPPSVWCLLGGVGQHVVSPCVVPPRPRHPPLPVSSPLQCGVS